MEPRAHAHIRQVIALAAGLLEVGAAYERDGQVYFRGSAVAHRAALDRTAALRLAADYGHHPDDPRKDDPFDVAVWQASGAGESAWDSPWGPGRPGWQPRRAASAVALLITMTSREVPTAAGIARVNPALVLDGGRTLHRVTVIGEVPVGPDGRESELVAGKPFTDKHVVVVDD